MKKLIDFDALLEYSSEKYAQAEERARQYGMHDLANKFADAKETSAIFGRATKNKISFEYNGVQVQVKFLKGIFDNSFCNFATQIANYDGSAISALNNTNALCIVFERKAEQGEEQSLDVFLYPLGQGIHSGAYCFICSKQNKDYRTIQSLDSFKSKLFRDFKKKLDRKEAQTLINKIADATGMPSIKTGLSWRWFA